MLHLHESLLAARKHPKAHLRAPHRELNLHCSLLPT